MMQRLFITISKVCVIFFILFSSLCFAQDIRDIKPPVDPPTSYFWLILFLLGVAITGVVYLIRYLVNRYKKNKKEKVMVKPPWEIALEQLRALIYEDLPKVGQIKEHYIRLSDIVRHYIENRFDIRAPEMTTQEFLLFLKYSYELKNHHKELLKDFLNSCDMVKFAKYGPTLSEIENSNGLAKRFIEETKEAPPVLQKG